MPKPTHPSDEDSDDFEDAVETFTTSHGQSTNEVIMEEIIDKQYSMSLNDKDEDNKPVNTVDNPEELQKINDLGSEEFQADEYEIDEESLRKLEENMTSEEIERNKLNANKMKLEANDFFKNDESEKALRIYTEALKVCPTTYPKERAVLYGNRAAAKIKIGSKETAIEDCTRALELWPEYVRVLLRRAKLYENDNKLENALDDYKKVYEIDPGQQDAREACIRLPPIIQEQNEKLKAEMMTKLKDLGNMILKPFGLSTDNFKVQQDPNSGSYSVNFNQNAG